MPRISIQLASLRMGTLLIVLLSLLAGGPVELVRAAKPNVLLIVTDDQRPDTIHALGNSVIRTPNIDTLVARGTSFRQAFAGYPICHVSRAEILTGCHAFHALPSYPGGAIDPKLATLASTFQSAGYHTWYCGKWHNDGQPQQRGYLATRGLFSSGGASKEARGRAVDSRGNPLTGYVGWTFKNDQGQPLLDFGSGLQPTNSIHIADGAIEAIKQSPADKPFLLHVNFAFPHDPRQWPADTRHRYGIDEIQLPANFAAVHPFDHGNINGRDELLLPTPRDPQLLKTELAIYYAMVSDVDAQIGRIVAALSPEQLRDTLIVLTSDQGLALGSHGLLGKQNQYQHSIRSPLIVAGPGVDAAQKIDQQVMLLDIMPTLCELTGLTVPASVQGVSFAPLLRGSREQLRAFVTGAFTDTQRMICDGQWKLIVYPQAKRVQLFHIADDPDERFDLSSVAQHQPIRLALNKQLRQWCQANGDKTLWTFE